MTATSRSSSEETAPALRYRDLDKAVAWLCATFDFEVLREVHDKDGLLSCVELSTGNDTLSIVSANDADAQERAIISDIVGGPETQSTYVLVEDINALRVKATQAKLDIVFDLKADKFVGRSFGCKDLEGHIWYFGSSTSVSAKPQPTPAKTAARTATHLALGLIIFATGFLGWLHLNSTFVDSGAANSGSKAAKTAHADPAENTTARPRRPIQDAASITQPTAPAGSPQEPPAATIGLVEVAPAAQANERPVIEQTVRQTMATVQPAQAKEVAIDVGRTIAHADQSRADEPDATNVPPKPEHNALSAKLQAKLQDGLAAPFTRVRVIVDPPPTDAGATNKLAADEKTQPDAPPARVFGVTATAFDHTRRLLSKARERRRAAARSAIVGLAAAVAVQTDRPIGHPAARRPARVDINAVPGDVAPNDPDKTPSETLRTTIAPAKAETNEVAKRTPPWPTHVTRTPAPRAHSPALPKQLAPASTSGRQDTTAIENARRLAEKLRKRQQESQQAKDQKQPVKKERVDSADGDATPGTATKAEDVLRRAFISKW